MLSAVALARKIETGDLTPEAIVSICAEAIAAREADIGAFAALDLNAAKHEARDRGDALRSSPLRGLPIGFKDIFDTVDFPTCYGSPIYTGHRPASDAAMVALARRAGGIVLGKTVSTELAFLDPAGTRNPHNLEHTPGGSSSGSAAAIAAGFLPITVGSQTGGSIIRPASFCGVAGFKPSYRLFPTVGMKCFSWALDTVGLFGAGVADVAFAAAALSGRDLCALQSSASPRIALVRTHVWSQASPAMQDGLERAARLATRAGAAVRDLALPKILEDAFVIHGTIQNYEATRALAFEYDRHRERLSDKLRAMLDGAIKITPEVYDDARRVAKRAREAYAELFSDFDVLLTPSATGAAPRGLSSTGEPTFNRLWTLMGAPCVNVPGLKDNAGMPLGVQVVGRFGRDRAALEAAVFIEAALAGS